MIPSFSIAASSLVLALGLAAVPPIASTMPRPTLLGIAGGLSTARADDPAARRIEFAPKPGTKSAKTFHLVHTLALQSMKLEIDGQQQSSQKQLDVSTRITLRAHDEYRALDAGRPTLLARTFDEYQMHSEFLDPGGNKPADKLDAASPLTGATVLFTWVPAEKAYGRCYELLEPSEEFLARVEEDFDLRGFLPTKAVKPGETWDVDTKHLAEFLAPCGDLPLRFSKGGEGFSFRTLSLGVGGPLQPVVTGPLEGKITARLRSIDHVSAEKTDGDAAKGGDAELAHIEIEIQVKAHCDQTALAQRLVQPIELYDGQQMRKSELEWKLEGQGTITWDLSTGTCRAAEWHGAEEVASDIAFEVQKPKSSVHTSIRLAGGLKLDFDSKTSAPKLPK